MPTKIAYDKEDAEAYLGAAIAAYSEALEIVLQALAQTKGTDDMQWFDRLRDEMIRTAKGTTTEQISIELDAGAVGFGFQALDTDLKGIRRRLIEE